LKVLFDQGTPAPLKNYITSHQVSTAYDIGWSTLKNGELLAEAENNGFQVLVTTDMNLQYQQNLKDRRIAIVVLSTTSWPRIKSNISAVISAIDAATPNTFQTVLIS